jgi:hypothetical protein
MTAEPDPQPAPDTERPTGAGSAPSRPRRVRKPVVNLAGLLDSLADETDGEKVSVAELIRAVGRRSYGPLLTLLGFVAISPLTIVPGATMLVATVTLLVASQMLVGRSHPWIPRRILKVSFPRTAVLDAAKAARGWVAPVDRLLAPRLVFLTEPPFVMAVAALCVAAALITYPLSFVPIAPIVPGLAIMLLGLGVTARDGVMIVLAMLAVSGAALLVARLWHLLPWS